MHSTLNKPIVVSFFHILFFFIIVIISNWPFFYLQILVNRAIAQSRLADTQEAKSDFLKALQAKVEPRHRAIDDFLDSWEVRLQHGYELFP